MYAFAEKFLDSCFELVDLVESCRVEAGLPASDRRVRLHLKEDLLAVRSKCRMHANKQEELQERLRGRINVVSRAVFLVVTLTTRSDIDELSNHRPSVSWPRGTARSTCL
jgi:hypothetical protein